MEVTLTKIKGIYLIIFSILLFFMNYGLSASTLRYAVGTELETIDPSLASGVPEHNVLLSLFEGLTSYDPKTSLPEPGVAEKWESNEDATVWRFFLRKNAKWSDRKPVTAHDFVYGWQRILDPKTAARYAYYLYGVKNANEYNTGKIKDPEKIGIKALDDLTLEITLVGPTPYFPKILAHYATYPLPKAVIKKYGDKWTQPENIVSNGPFVLSERILNQHVKVKKNTHYWDSKNVKLDEIIFSTIEDKETNRRQYLSGELDWIDSYSINPQYVPKYSKRNDYHQYIYIGSYFYRFNTTRKPFSDPRVRKALSMSIDRKKLAKYITKGTYLPTNAYVPPALDNEYNKEAPQGLKEDLKAAKELLASAGFPDGKDFPPFEILYNTLEQHRDITQAIQQMWRQNLGIECKLFNQEWKIYLKSEHTLDYDVARAGWIADFMDPINFVDMFTSDSGLNDTGWKNKKYDNLIEKARHTGDSAERNKFLRAAEKILIEEDLPIMPIFFYTSRNMVSPKVKNWYNNPLDVHPYKHMYINQ